MNSWADQTERLQDVNFYFFTLTQMVRSEAQTSDQKLTNIHVKIITITRVVYFVNFMSNLHHLLLKIHNLELNIH